MKKLFAIVAALAAFATFAASVVPIPRPQPGVPFSVRTGGKLSRVEAFSTVASGTVELKSVYRAETFTNAVSILTATNFTYEVVSSNALNHALATNVYHSLSFEADPDVIGVSTNVLVSATTNVCSISSGVVSVTNDVASGTASGHVLRKALETPVFIGPNETMIFTGSATNGWLRLVFE